ncbi:MAG TPA: cytochrome c [Thermoanaerobaculia bacterium]|nr:cytochrome c [Thermoanaerobaculia bacterium]
MTARTSLPLIAASALALVAAAAATQEEQGSIWDGVYTVEQAERGESLYSQGCAECHGEGLGGDDMNPPLLGSDFLWDWNGLSAGDLFERLVISMPEGDPRSMSPQEKADVLAFMLMENELPAGEEELSSSANDLRRFRIDAVKPAS